MMHLNKIHQQLYDWYARHGREDLPWRHTDDAYEIYLSEVMLQQTQVKTVLERYYHPFLERFPSLELLAKAPLDDVLKAWEGLGYYTRARNLHACSQKTAPTLPQSYDELLALPGIGKNTASAICAFAYHQPYAVMEANVKRILCRIFAHKTPEDKVLQADALALLDVKKPFDYNQAMMDIGAMVCTPKAPDCKCCPLRQICKAYAENDFAYPEKKSKQVPIREERWLVRSSHDKLFLQQRKGKFLQGLWGFEKLEEGEDRGVYIGEVKQSYTHFKLRAEIYHDSVKEEDAGFFTLLEIAALALSGVDKKVLNLLKKKEIFTSLT